jgi:hypothetical protein
VISTSGHFCLDVCESRVRCAVQGCFVGVREEYVPLVGPLIDELLDKFFHQGGKRHAQQWQSWLDAASGKDGATALRTKLKVLQVCASPQPAH